MIFYELQQKLNRARSYIESARVAFHAAQPAPADKPFEKLLQAVDELQAAVQTLYETALPEEEVR